MHESHNFWLELVGIVLSGKDDNASALTSVYVVLRCRVRYRERRDHMPTEDFLDDCIDVGHRVFAKVGANTKPKRKSVHKRSEVYVCACQVEASEIHRRINLFLNPWNS